MAEIGFAPLAAGGAVKCGVFTGDGQQNHFIDLGITPTWVSIWRNNGMQSSLGVSDNVTAGGLAIQGHPCRWANPNYSGVAFQIVDGGFVVNASSDGWNNHSNTDYYYLYGI